MSLGDRVKRYEKVSQHQLSPRMPLFIRIDGRAFHTYTRGMDRPFDSTLESAMVYAMQKTAEDMSGFVLAYHQSDEVTFMLQDFSGFDTQGWFDYDLNKVVSMSASLFTAYFNQRMQTQTPATFDSRAFSVPLEDAANVFLWRQRDWERNSLQMLSRAHFSHKELHGKRRQDMHEMLHSKGVNWADLDPHLKNGTFLTGYGAFLSDRFEYDGLNSLIERVINGYAGE